MQLIGCRYHGDAAVKLLLTVIILQFNFEFAVHILRAQVLAAQLNLLVAPIQAQIALRCGHAAGAVELGVLVATLAHLEYRFEGLRG